MRRAIVLVVGMLVACGPPHPVEPPHAAGDPSFDALFADVAQRAQGAGAGAFADAAHGYGAEGERIGAFVDVPADACVLVAAAGSSGVTDIDAFAYADDGATVAADERPDARATFLVCPPHPARVWVSARIVTGAGALVIASSPVAVERADAVSKAAGARTASTESGRLDSWPRLEERVRARRKSIGGRWDDLRRIALQVDPRAPTRTTIDVLPNRCIDVFLAPSDEVGVVDLVAEDADGRIVARGEPDSGAAQVLLLCARTAETISLSMRPREAPGLAALVVGQSEEGAEHAIARALHVEHIHATEPLEAAQKTLGALLSAAGFGSPKLVGTAEIRVGTRTPFTLALPRGCTRVDAIAGVPLGAFGFSMWETDGQLLAEVDGGPRATAYACGEARSVDLDAEAEARPGPLAVETRSVPDPPKAFIDHPLAASRLLGAVYGEGTALLEGWDRVAVVALAPSERIRQPLSIAAHACVDVAIAVGSGASGIELRLADEIDHADTIARGRFVAIDRACAGAAQVERTIEVRLTTGEGEGLLLVRPTTR